MVLAALVALAAVGCGNERVGNMSASYEGRTKVIMESTASSKDNVLMSQGFGGFDFKTHSIINLSADSPLPDCNIEIAGEVEDGKPKYYINSMTVYKGKTNDGLGCMGEVEEKQMKRVKITGGTIENDPKSGDATLIVYYKPADSESQVNYEMHMVAHKKGWF